MKPKYMVIYDNIVSQLDNEQYVCGDMLPSETDLCTVYSASRMTVNKVIQMLVQEGRLERTRGKGTFVTEPQVTKDILKLTSFTEDIQHIGKLPGSTILEYRMKFDVDATLIDALQLDEGDFVHVIKRVRTADGEPVALDIDNISSKVAKQIEVDQIKHSLYYFLENNLQIEIAYSDFEIKSRKATADVARHLGIKAGDPILYIRHTTYSKKGIPIEYCQTYYRADKYSLSIRAYR